MSFLRLSALFCSAAACLTSEAFAQAGDSPGIDREAMRRQTTMAVGVAAVVNDEPYAGIDATVLPVPFFLYNKGDITIAGPNLTWRFAKLSGTQLSAEGRYRFQNLDPDDSDALDGMDDRDGTYELGLRAMHRIGKLRLEAMGFADVANQHDGYELTGRLGYELGDGLRYSLRPQGGVRLQSQNLINHYYGVRADEALASRPFTFLDEDAVVPFVGAQGYMRVSRRIQLQGRANLDFLPDTITNSPIVEDDHRFSLFVGFNYLLKGPGLR
ncbi:MAG: MipA/OmpV family protein [Parvularcula sp.]|jgi:outer membrane protein|nr:MipA/OmpV family protein [Parvularcula sp.]